jgi:hypothetical protein
MCAAQKLQQSNPRINHGSAFAGKRVTGDDPLKRIASSPAANTPDVEVSCHGSIYIFTPLTPAAREWVAEFLPEDAQQWAGGTVVEHRFIAEIILGARRDGLSVVRS